MEKNTARISAAVLRYAGLTLLAFLLVFVFRRVLRVNPTTVALSFLVLILITASRWRLAYSLYLSLLCALLYNVFFLPPIGRITIRDPQNLVALAAFLCASFLVSHLSDREHSEAELSEIRHREVQHLYEFSQELLLHDDLSTIARITPSIAAEIFGFRAVALYVRDGDTAYYSDPEYELVSLSELKNAAHATDPTVTVIDGIHLVPLLLGMRSMGAIAFRGEQSTNIYEAIGTLVAIALERAAALERTSHMEAARESERLHSALLDSVTHDLRTPLTSIRAAATTLISQPQMSEHQRLEMYAVVDEESFRLDRLIGQAMEMAQLDAASIHVEARPESMREIIEVALEEAQPLLDDRTVDVDVPENLPDVAMDRRLVGRALHHLIENAAMYSPSGSPLRIGSRIEDHRLLVNVEDHGSGIEDFEQPLIFNKFYRGRNQKPGISGTGMGLAIVKAIMVAHGGGIEVRSRPPQGALFTIWLPFKSNRPGDSV